MIKRKKSYMENRFEINLGFCRYIRQDELNGYWRNYSTELTLMGLGVYRSKEEKYDDS